MILKKYSDLCTIFIVTYYSHNKIKRCLDSLSRNYKTIVFDNAGELNNKKEIEKNYPNVKYIVSKRNLGIPRAYNFGLNFINTEYMFTTQPDVILKNNCLDYLIEAAIKYPEAGILSPTIYHDGKYILDGDFKSLSIDKYKKNIVFNNNFFNKNIYNKIPEGDFCVEGVTGTAMLIKRSFLKNVGGWDKKIFSYWEDMDICARLRFNNNAVIKVSKARLDHSAFSSHDKTIHKKMDYFRNWHYMWSSYYIRKKHKQYKSALFFALSSVVLHLLKIIIYCILVKKNKVVTSKAKLMGLLNSILNKKSYFRIS
jgi:N-acetylglucosaminyl-diphospho-decaprenol L-rhamnosyltransferase